MPISFSIVFIFFEFENDTNFTNRINLKNFKNLVIRVALSKLVLNWIDVNIKSTGIVENKSTKNESFYIA